MEKETLDSFFAIQGVTGIALLGQNSRPYFFRSFEDLSKAQQQALSQGLFQVLENMPADFDFFDFQFASQRVFVYALNQQWALLVAVEDILDFGVYAAAVDKLRAELSQNTSKGLATFRLFARQVDTQNPTIGSTMVPASQFLDTLNRLSSFICGYLGRAVIVNYWKVTRGEVIQQHAAAAELLNYFQIDRSAEIRYSGSLVFFDAIQMGWLQMWVGTFLQRCAEVIHNFRALIRSANLDAADWQILLK